MATDFFISYNGADCSWVEWIAWQLEDVGYATVIQAWDFRPGSNFVLEMQRAASEAKRTIAVLSPNYLEALYTHPEWAAAFAQDPTGAEGTLIPVRVRECELKGLLSQIVYIDLVGSEKPKAAKNTLLAGVNRSRTKPSAPPVYPKTSKHPTSKRPHFPGVNEANIRREIKERSLLGVFCLLMCIPFFIGMFLKTLYQSSLPFFKQVTEDLYHKYPVF